MQRSLNRGMGLDVPNSLLSTWRSLEDMRRRRGRIGRGCGGKNWQEYAQHSEVDVRR